MDTDVKTLCHEFCFHAGLFLGNIDRVRQDPIVLQTIVDSGFTAEKMEELRALMVDFWECSYGLMGKSGGK